MNKTVGTGTLVGAGAVGMALAVLGTHWLTPAFTPTEVATLGAGTTPIVAFLAEVIRAFLPRN